MADQVENAKKISCHPQQAENEPPDVQHGKWERFQAGRAPRSDGAQIAALIQQPGPQEERISDFADLHK